LDVPGAGDGLGDDVMFLDAGCEELCFGAGEERFDDLGGGRQCRTLA